MKKYMFISLILIAYLFQSCTTKLVFYPLPVTLELSLPVSTTTTNFSTQSVLPGQVIANEIFDQLEGVSVKDIEKITLEAVAFTVSNASDASPNFSGQLEVAYGNPNFITLLSMNNLNIGQIQGHKQVTDLQANAVQLLNNAVNDILINQSSQSVFFRAQGSLNPPPSGTLSFNLVIELTVTPVVKQEQDIFDPLGG